jgi:hypothetical protein
MSDRTCKYPGCVRKLNARGYCAAHYARLRDSRDMDAPIQSRAFFSGRPCSVDGCDRSTVAGGFCSAHYQRSQHGVDMGKPLRQSYAPGQECSVDGCDRSPKSLGYCAMHYGRQLGRGRECKYPGCANDIVGGGRSYCAAHYARHRTGRDMDRPITPRVTYAIHDECGFWTAHTRVTRQWGAASQYPCVNDCGFYAEDWAYDGTDPAQLYGFSNGSHMFYSRYPEFYMPLCKGCHHSRDKGSAARELRQYRRLLHEFGLTHDEMYRACKREASVKRLREAADLEESA